MPDPSVETFNRLIRIERPARTPKLFGTACVIGGSIAGLLAARVLADHAREVVIIERDDLDLDLDLDLTDFDMAGPRAGVPQDRHGHVLLPAGLKQLERWLPGVIEEATALGGYLAGPDQQVVYLDGRPRVQAGDAKMLLGSRPFLEARIRSRVLALPNVSTLVGSATGLIYTQDGHAGGGPLGGGHGGGGHGGGGRIGGVQAGGGQASGGQAGGGRIGGVRVGDVSVPADFVVDAMGRASKLAAWVERAGYERPPLLRMPTGIHYATAHFARTEKAANIDRACVLALFSPGSMPAELTVAHTSVIEDDQWLVMLMSYDEHPAARSLDAFRSTCGELAPVFQEASSGHLTRDIQTYHQADSRRRDFAGLSHFPAGLVAVGDAVASFNPIYGQGISSAALHASCLSEYLTTDPDLSTQATEFFALQQVVTVAAWTISAGGDQARLDAIAGTKVSDEVERQRWAMNQIVRATLVDPAIADAFSAVTYMEAHPATLAAPALLERATAINQPTT